MFFVFSAFSPPASRTMDIPFILDHCSFSFFVSLTPHKISTSQSFGIFTTSNPRDQTMNPFIFKPYFESPQRVSMTQENALRKKTLGKKMGAKSHEGELCNCRMTSFLNRIYKHFQSMRPCDTRFQNESVRVNEGFPPLKAGEPRNILKLVH